MSQLLLTRLQNRQLKTPNLICQIELVQPDYSKQITLTTDASDLAIGAELSQDGYSITFISKTLNKTERNYAAYKKELLAIVWALKNLRNYLYGVSGIEIHTAINRSHMQFRIKTQMWN